MCFSGILCVCQHNIVICSGLEKKNAGQKVRFSFWSDWMECVYNLDFKFLQYLYLCPASW